MAAFAVNLTLINANREASFSYEVPRGYQVSFSSRILMLRTYNESYYLGVILSDQFGAVASGSRTQSDQLHSSICVAHED